MCTQSLHIWLLRVLLSLTLPSRQLLASSIMLVHVVTLSLFFLLSYFLFLFKGFNLYRGTRAQWASTLSTHNMSSINISCLFSFTQLTLDRPGLTILLVLLSSEHQWWFPPIFSLNLASPWVSSQRNATYCTNRWPVDLFENLRVNRYTWIFTEYLD